MGQLLSSGSLAAPDTTKVVKKVTKNQFSLVNGRPWILIMEQGKRLALSLSHQPRLFSWSSMMKLWLWLSRKRS